MGYTCVIPAHFALLPRELTEVFQLHFALVIAKAFVVGELGELSSFCQQFLTNVGSIFLGVWSE